MVALQVHWMKCQGDVWCSLRDVNLDLVRQEGVYTIWHEGNPGRVVRHGQGKVADRLRRHRNDSTVLYYRSFGTLRVTWASVPSAQRDGVERYLAETWPPLLGDAFPNVDPIAVNSPW